MIFWLFSSFIYLPRELGLATAILGIVSWISIFSLLGLNDGIQRFFPTGKFEYGKAINTAFLANFITAMSLILFFRIFFPLVVPQYQHFFSNNISFFIFLLISISIGLFKLQIAFFISLEKNQIVFTLVMVEGIIRIILCFLLMNYGVLGILSAFGFPPLIIFFFLEIFVIPKSIQNYYTILGFEKNFISKTLKYSLGNFFAKVINGAGGIIYPTLILSFLSEEEVAFFFIPWIIMNAINSVPNSISTTFLITVIKRPNELQNAIIKAILMIFLFLVPSLVFVAFFGKAGFSVLGDGYVDHSFPLLLLLIITSLFATFNSLFISISKFKENMTPIIFSYLLLLTITSLSGFILLKPLGIIAMGIGWFLSNLILSFYALPFIWKFIRRDSLFLSS